MSYCRWSSDGWRCDVYCYADVSGGYTTHVASATRMHREGKPCPNIFENGIAAAELMVRYKAHNVWMEETDIVPLGLPHDGETFRHANLEEFRECLAGLWALGYHVPDYVFEEIDAEIKEEAENERN